MGRICWRRPTGEWVCPRMTVVTQHDADQYREGEALLRSFGVGEVPREYTELALHVLGAIARNMGNLPADQVASRQNEIVGSIGQLLQPEAPPPLLAFPSFIPPEEAVAAYLRSVAKDG
jgi:hypothetical protein